MFFRKKMFMSLFTIFIILGLVTACGSSSDDSSAGNDTSDQEEQSENNENNTENEGNSEEGENADTSGSSVTLSIGTSPNGSAFNTTATGVASVASENSNMNVSVKPFAGPAAWMPMLNHGDLAMGLISYTEAKWAKEGTNGYETNENLRSLVRGNFTTTIGAVVREDSDIQTVSDLEGKRIASDYAGNLVVMKLLESLLAANEMSWDDVNKVPVPSAVAGIEALQNGRVDAAFGLGPTTSFVVEADNAVGLRPLDFVDIDPDELDSLDPSVKEEFTSRIAGSRFKVLNEGYLKEDTIGGQYPLMLAVSAEVSEDDAYNMVKTLWENYDKLHPIFSWLEGWTPEQMFDPNPIVPYHSGVVKFFEEQGVWTEEAEQNQQELLDQ